MTEKDTIKCESIFSDDRAHRYWWKRVWNKDKPTATVIMINPFLSDNIVTDTTTSLVVNNIARTETYGGVIIVNLYSRLTSKLSFRWNSDEELNSPENDNYIQKAAEESAIVVLAWGKAADANQRIVERVDAVCEMLDKHKEKLFSITDGEREGLHPLTPSIRNKWDLVPYKKDEDPPVEKRAEGENKAT